jgi:hypothetical protein
MYHNIKKATNSLQIGEEEGRVGGRLQKNTRKCMRIESGFLFVLMKNKHPS